jgi:hypothetical protein
MWSKKVSFKRGIVMKKSAILFSFAASASVLLAQGPPPGFGGPGGFGDRFGMPGSRTPVTGAPYSAARTTQIQQVLSDGNQITKQDQSKVYRDSMGRVRTEYTFNRPAAAGETATPQTVVTIFDPVAGFSYSLNPAKLTAMKSTVHLAPAGSANSSSHVHANSSAQLTTENLGTQAVNGVSAIGTRVTRTIPAGAIGNQQPIQIVRETWVSSDLKVPVLIKSSDPRFGTTVTQLTGIVQAEPDASLFVVPSNYTVSARTRGMERGARTPPAGN